MNKIDINKIEMINKKEKNDKRRALSANSKFTVTGLLTAAIGILILFTTGLVSQQVPVSYLAA